MAEREKTVVGAVRELLHAALLVLGTGLTLLDGWVLGGVVGTIGAVFCAVVFLALWLVPTDKDQEAKKKLPPSNRRVITLAVCVSLTLLVFVGNV